MQGEKPANVLYDVLYEAPRQRRRYRIRGGKADFRQIKNRKSAADLHFSGLVPRTGIEPVIHP